MTQPQPSIDQPAPFKPVGFGILGLHQGRRLLETLGQTDAGATHIGPLDRVPEAFAAMACDINPERIEAQRALNPEVRYTTDYEEMLRNPEVEVVAVFTPDPLHAEHIVRAMRTGKHVIVTKPIVCDIEGARQVLSVSRQTGMKLLVGQSTRFFEPFMRQRAAFERGALGELEVFEAQYNHRMDFYFAKSPWSLQESDWVFLGLSHPIDLATWYMGDIDAVQAFGYRSSMATHWGLKGFDIYTVNLRDAQGRPGRIMGHYGLHELHRARNAVECLLYGSLSTSLAQYQDMRYLYVAPDGTEVVEDSLYAKRAYYFNNAGHGSHWGEFANYARHFARAIREGTPHQPDVIHGLKTFAVMCAVRDSAQEEGKLVHVQPYLERIGLTQDAVGSSAA